MGGSFMIGAGYGGEEHAGAGLPGVIAESLYNGVGVAADFVLRTLA